MKVTDLDGIILDYLVDTISQTATIKNDLELLVSSIIMTLLEKSQHPVMLAAQVDPVACISAILAKKFLEKQRPPQAPSSN